MCLYTHFLIILRIRRVYIYFSLTTSIWCVNICCEMLDLLFKHIFMPKSVCHARLQFAVRYHGILCVGSSSLNEMLPSPDQSIDIFLYLNCGKANVILVNISCFGLNQLRTKLKYEAASAGVGHYFNDPGQPV